MSAVNPSTFQNSISADGNTIVGYWFTGTENPISRAFRWTTSAGLTELAGFDGKMLSNNAWAVSPDGLYVAGNASTATGRAPALWDGAGVPHLIDNTVANSSLTFMAVANGGRAVVGYRSNSSNGQHRAFIWDQVHGTREVGDVLTSLGISYAGWTLTEAQGITPDGLKLVGTGINPQGMTDTWIATIPAPGGVACLGGGLFLVARRRR